MGRVQGEFFEAESSESVKAQLRFIDDRVSLEGVGFSRNFEFDQLEISDRLASLPRRVHFPDGSLFCTRDNTTLDQLLTESGRVPKGSLISFFESGWRWTVLALFALPVALYFLFTVGMPIIATPLAQAVPESIKDRLDVEIVEFLDARLMKPSELSGEKRRQMDDAFNDLGRWTEGISLNFRKGDALGANALAMPGGTIIMTDELIELIEFDGEFYAVIAHEIGHIKNNHSMRNLVQVAGISMVLGWMLGDLSLVTDMVLVGVPTVLQQLSYSRTFENDADQFALIILKQKGYSTACFSSLIEKLSKAHEHTVTDLPGYLSSHPESRSRIALGKSDKLCSAGKS